MAKSIKKLRDRARESYKTLKPVRCPFLGGLVHFTSEGFNHLRYKGARSERSLASQEIRYKRLNLVTDLLKNSKTLQEYDEQKLFFDNRENARKEKILKKVRYFGFIAIIDGWKLKVIVRQVGKGELHFWSLIPNWQTRKSKEGKKSYKNFTGNLSKD